MRHAVATFAIASLSLVAGVRLSTRPAPTAPSTTTAPTTAPTTTLSTTAQAPATNAHPDRVRFRLRAGQDAPAGATRIFDAPDDDALSRWWQIDVAIDGDTGPGVDLLVTLADISDVFEDEPAFEPALLAAGARDHAVDHAVDVDVDGSAACPITTPPYDERQGYLQATHARVAWHLDGGRGQGVRIADVEGDWNGKHEDLPQLIHVAGRPQGWGWRQHGTAVLGVVVARDNGKGMTGIVPEVDGVYTASLGDVGAARAIHETAKKLSPGDVILIELHGPGPNSRGKKGQQGFVPMEWWQAEFDAIKWATDHGIVVVEAAGNGAENLDAPIYDGKFDRARRDSGAVLVGAGTSTLRQTPPPRSRLGFSNYGGRVDVHGWGEDVASLDYGDLQGCSSADRKYTARFSGTSSASPVVAGAVAVIEGVYKKKHGAALAPAAVRALLKETGTPQQPSSTAPLSQPIGPLPNVEAALRALALVP